MSLKKITENEATGIVLGAPRGGKCNYLVWLDHLVDTLGPRFGNLAKVLKTHVAYVVPPISQADYIGQVGVDPGNNDGINLTDANVRELKMKAIAARNAEVRELAKEMPKFFNSIHATLSQESKQLVQAHDDFANAYAGEDANELLRIVRETHFTNVNGGGQAAQSIEDILNKQQEFAMLKQKNGESIAVFKKQFDDMVKTLTSMGAPAMTEAQLGMSFLLKLDAGRHGNMLVELRNQAARGVGYPDTLKKAYDLASNWHTTVQEKTSGGDMHSVFVLSDNVRAPSSNKSPAAVTGKEKTGGGKGGGKSRFNNNQPPQPQRSQSSGGKKGGGANDIDAGSTSAATVTGDNSSGGERRKCHLCKQPGHLLANCPSNPFAKGGSSSSSTAGTNLIAAVVGEEDDHDTDDTTAAEYIYREDDDDEDVMRNFVVVTPPSCCCQQEHRSSACTTTTTTHAFMFGEHEVLFDCAAGRSVMKSRDLLHNIKQSSTITTIGGVNKDSEGITVSEDGEFADLGRVGVSAHSVANILSQAELLDKGFGVSYDTSRDQYCVQGTKKNWVFKRKRLPSGKRSPFYSCEVLVTTVQDNLRRYTAREVKQAKKALELQRFLGYPSINTMVHMLGKGVLNCEVTPTDVRNAEAIFGKSVAALKGKTKTKSAAIATSILAPRVTQVQQTMQVDVMFIKAIPFLVGVMSPLGLVVSVPLTDRGTSTIAKALKGFVTLASSRNFQVQEVRADGEGAIGANVDQLRHEGIVVSTAGPGEHVPVVERMIQTIKSRVRAFENTLPFVMPKAVIAGCVMSVVRNINVQPNAQSTDGLSPQEQFTGLKLDAKRDLRCGCGDYVQARVPVTDNSMQPRTEGCIVLYPTGNTTGSVAMLKLSTLQQVIRDQFVVLPMPDQVIAHLNSLAKRQGLTRGRDEPLPLDNADNNDESVTQDADGHATIEPVPLPDMMPFPSAAAGVAVIPHTPTSLASEVGVNASPAVVNADNVVNAADDDRGAPNVVEPFTVRTSLRIANRRTMGGNNPQYVFINNPFKRAEMCGEIRKQLMRRIDWHDVDFAFTMSVKAALRERKEEAEPVILAELKQMLDKGVWHGVHVRNLTRQQRRAIIRSSMFLKDKYLASGAFEKFKARLVAGGDQQDKGLYDDLSSPTAATSSVLCVAAIAAAEGRFVITIDIGGAFLNADLQSTGIKVHMRLNKLMTSMLVHLDRSYEQFVEPDGTLVVELDKALYGCVEAAYLWYKELISKLKAYGFKENPYDCCVLNMTGAGGEQVTIALHVDDLLVTCVSEEELVKLKSYLDSVYAETKMHTGKVLDYIGMSFNYEVPGEVKVTMKNCIDDILESCEREIKKRKTPAASTLFDVRENAPKATLEETKYFHTHVAKVLYLAKRVRPECLTAVAFLATRVQKCDVDDLAKLRRLLGYLAATRERGIVLRVGDRMTVKAYIDAAYGVHTDSGRSHTGCVIVLGNGGPVFAKSTKQKIVTKSSTEAELVGVSDSASQAVHLRNFIAAQGYATGPAIVYQDNLSCMALMKRGGPSSQRSRHINIRHFWVKEKVDEGELCFEHLSTQGMHANLLTKPVQGAQFERERQGLTNWL